MKIELTGKERQVDERCRFKFRAWDAERGVMHPCAAMVNCRWSVMPDGSGIATTGSDPKPVLHIPTLVPLQYTGRQDMQNAEIYEGDILLVEVEQNIGPAFRGIAVIQWGEAGWDLDFRGDGTTVCVQPGQMEFLQVLGNEFQHPDRIFQDVPK
jgi:YopX protein